MSQTHKILIRTPNWLGDAVLALPAIEAVKRAFPEYELHVLTLKHLKGLYELHPLVSKVIPMEKKTALKTFFYEWSLAGKIRKDVYEIAFIFPSSFHSSLIPFLARIPVRIGYRKNGRSLMLTRSFPVKGDYKQTIHQSRFYIDLIEKFTRTAFDDSFSRLSIPEDLRINILKKLESRDFSSSNLIGLAPGAEYGPAKQWPLSHWHVLASTILKETDYSIVITGTGKDKEAAKFLKDQTKGRIIDMTGELSLEEFFALLSMSSCFISNDSGAMHAAAAVRTPVVGIFGSTSPIATSPLGDRSILLYKGVRCSPCFERECPLKHYQCLMDVEPDEVFDALKTFI